MARINRGISLIFSLLLLVLLFPMISVRAVDAETAYPYITDYQATKTSWLVQKEWTNEVGDGSVIKVTLNNFAEPQDAAELGLNLSETYGKTVSKGYVIGEITVYTKGLGLTTGGKKYASFKHTPVYTLENDSGVTAKTPSEKALTLASGFINKAAYNKIFFTREENGETIAYGYALTIADGSTLEAPKFPHLKEINDTAVSWEEGALFSDTHTGAFMQASLETLEAPVADPEGSTTSFNIGTLELYVNGLPTNQKGAYFSANYTLENAEDATISPENGAASALIPAAEFNGSKQKLVLTQSGKTYAYTVRILDGAPKPTYTLDASTTLLWEEQGDKPSNRVGIVTFTNESNIAILKAAAGDRVTATATPRELSPYAYQFKEWVDSADTGIITDENKHSAAITFDMPDSAVNLFAVFEATGTTVSWQTSGGNESIILHVAGLTTAKSPRVFKTNATISAGMPTEEWHVGYTFVGWSILVDGVDRSNDSSVVTYKPSHGDPSYATIAQLTVTGKTMEITAKFSAKSFGAVEAVSDDALKGTAAVTVDGDTATRQSVVFEGQTVTLTATPADRYKLDHWTVTAPDGSEITTTPDASDANKATFVMPALETSGGTVTAKVYFVLDPSQASGEKTLSAELLAADGSSLGDKCVSSREGSMITLTLAPDVDTSDLASMRLKLTCSDHATVKRLGDDDNWPEAGKACNMTLGQEVKFVVTAENGTTADYTIKIVQQKQLSSEKAITGVGLIYGGETFATGTLDESATTPTWTITLPDDIDPTLLGKIGTATDVFMKIDYTGASLAQEKGYDDEAFDDKWDSGKIMCGVSPGSQQTFTVTAEDGSTKDYTIAITQPSVSGEPVLSNGNATRTSDTAATVTFTSSAAGSYYYKVVTSGAAEPDIDTSKSGNAAVAGSNTITLNNLTTGARDIYIVVKNAAGDVSNKLKIAIPAFGEDPDNPDNPDEGDFKITYTGPSGGKLVPSRTKANAGDVITVTVVPDAGMQMVAGSMKYTLGVAGGESTPITDGTFTMPSADVTLSCKWEAVKTSTDGITAFTIDGVAGVVDNTTNTISVVMAYGTDVTKLIPIISGNNIASISPASGQMVDFTNSVRYTVTLTDGTVKYYTVTVYVQEGTAADKMWDKLTDFYDQTPWWEYADHQVSTGRYPKYW